MPTRTGAHAHAVEFRRLFLIAKAIIAADPSLDNFEWCERIKDQLVRARLGYPERPDAIHDVMRAVEAIVARTPPPRLALVEAAIVEEPAPEDRARVARFAAEAWRVLSGKAMGAGPRENRTAAQIDAWRREQFAERPPTHRRTPKGWAPL